MAKGSEFERKICKRLSLWWTNEEKSDVFWRTSTSGARAKTRSKVGQSTFGQYGDIQATDPVGQPLIDMFTFELKIGYKHSSVADVLDKGPKAAQQNWEKWIDQVHEDHKNAGSLHWALITKRDRREPVIFIHRRAYKRLLLLSIINPLYGKSLNMIKIKLEFKNNIAFPLEEFLTHVNPKVIIDIVGEKNGRS